MSFIPESFSGPQKVKTEPIVTRDTAADALSEEQERKRRALLAGGTSGMLSGPGGVSSELTGTRQLY